MQHTDKAAIAQQLGEWLEEKGISQSEFARKIGKSAATITNLLKGKHTNIADGIFEDVAKQIGYKTTWQIAHIGNYDRVYKVCWFAQQRSIAQAISDDAGLGKSATLTSYAAQNKNVFYIECDEYYTKKIFLQKLLNSLGQKNSQGTIEEMVQAIIDTVSRLVRPLIIVDEVDMLKDAVLQLFKTLYNKLLGKCAFVLSGGLHFETRIRKGVSKNRQAYKEIFSRLGGEFVKLKQITNKDIRLICEANGLRSPELVQKACKMAESSDLRRIGDVVMKCLVEQQLEQQDGAAI